jgi:hypothetical protein
MNYPNEIIPRHFVLSWGGGKKRGSGGAPASRTYGRRLPRRRYAAPRNDMSLGRAGRMAEGWKRGQAGADSQQTSEV